MLHVIPLDKETVDLALRYSEKTGLISLELLMPEGIASVLHNSASPPDELSMSIIEGMSEKIEEVMENLPDGERLRLRLQIKKVKES